MADEREPAAERVHAVQDHAYGRELTHAHEPGASYDHDHDDFDSQCPLEANPIWIQDHVSLTSVGIDIGSSGTQVIFSQVNLRRLGENLSSHYFVVSRDTLFESPVVLTPYKNEERIDQVALGMIIDDAYNSAGIGPESIDIGAVILTGEALRRENAEAIAGIVAERAGDFVCATAGHHMEAMLAAFGSGAARGSADAGQRLLNVDIGGGTTKLAIIEAGRVVATAAFHIGGRLQVVDDRQRIVRLDPGGRLLAARAGFSWSVGDVVEPAELDALAEYMAAAVMRALRDADPPADIDDLYLTERLPEVGPIDGVMFSGGVAEYIYARESRDFGDVGRRLGAALRRKLQAGELAWPALPAKECIRATALGASGYSIQLTGNTIYISNHGALLPRRNVQVLKPSCEFPAIIDPQSVAEAIQRHLTLFDLAGEDKEFALAFQWRGGSAHVRVVAFARGIVAGLARTIALKRPLYLILDADLAQTLGGVLRDDLGVESQVLVLDGIMLVDFDYIDLGKIRLPSNTVPVTVKSLVFKDIPRSQAAPHHHHLRLAHSHSHSHNHSHDHDHDHDNQQHHDRENHGHDQPGRGPQFHLRTEK